MYVTWAYTYNMDIMYMHFYMNRSLCRSKTNLTVVVSSEVTGLEKRAILYPLNSVTTLGINYIFSALAYLEPSLPPSLRATGLEEMKVLVAGDSSGD